MTEICPGAPDGHRWVLDGTFREHYWVYRPRLTLFRKRIIYPASLSTPRFRREYHAFSVSRRWYCSKCRKFDTQTEVKDTFESVLKRGYAVYDWRNQRYLYPEIEDARRLIASPETGP